MFVESLKCFKVQTVVLICSQPEHLSPILHSQTLSRPPFSFSKTNNKHEMLEQKRNTLVRRPCESPELWNAFNLLKQLALIFWAFRFQKRFFAVIWHSIVCCELWFLYIQLVTAFNYARQIACIFWIWHELQSGFQKKKLNLFLIL